MAIAYFPDEDRHRVVITISGEIRVDHLVALLHHQVSDGTWDWPVIYDGTRRHQLFSTADLQILAAAARECARVNGRRGPVAIVRDTEAGFGVARMFGMLSADHTVALKVFRDRVEADKWLDTLGDLESPARQGSAKTAQRDVHTRAARPRSINRMSPS